MKKLLSMLLALTVAAAGSFPALSVVCAADDPGTNVTAKVLEPSADPISVDITWSAMEFTYKDGGWNTATHSYEAGSWTTTGGEITLQNNGTAEINAAFAYLPAEDITGVTGAFTYDTLRLSPGESSSTALSLSGKPGRSLRNTPIGTVTVTIAKPQNP
ncbi:MAG: hypothetical protein ACI4V3_01895 [Faecousia sp.]